ncbi:MULTISPECIES: magnesium transporter CorA family protein [unclassified Thermoactinomyces]|jgi:magnesium transporter|uniref:magnesium transporter CorA family protein n=1 Tax=unclassified Thermoactinomyces TaxID=2634588 RepID=UPI0018DE03EB|nr:MULTISPECIES: magnesium transporter CorA family protein [unclassified Thermoactinomyces]MBH8597632.1 magnesium transporter CorA family protein [Thermoactinomyces sp. CICC 10523]MBH8603973.1 magnesium transporter CorA family protein [Thermoactinomyces sp. CICC 10522]MBH8606493.1 magnesium transporter CorA family protein [Thermoactinomyces sp. CICC 10521]
MLNIYISGEDGVLQEINEFAKGAWVHLTAPDEEEIQKVVQSLGIPADFIRDPLDEEERSRIDKEGDNLLIIVDIPILENEGSRDEQYITIPLGMIVTPDLFITVCLKETPIVQQFITNKIKNFYTYMKTRFILQLLYRISTYYLTYLKQINRKTSKLENKLQESMQNQELFSMLSLEKSLVYFTTSLKTNNLVTEKLLKNQYLKMYEEDQHLLEDVIIENKQAMEMTEIYSHILSGMMDAFASVISNNVNHVMKVLTSFTIVLTFPTMVASLFGMNVPLPFEHYRHAFLIILLLSLLLSCITAMIFWKKKYF